MVLCSIETTRIRMTWRKLKGNSAILPRKTRKKEWKEKHSLLRESIKRNNPSLSFISFVFNLYSVVFWGGDFSSNLVFYLFKCEFILSIEEKVFFYFQKERSFSLCSIKSYVNHSTGQDVLHHFQHKHSRYTDDVFKLFLSVIYFSLFLNIFLINYLFLLYVDFWAIVIILS